MLTTSGYRRSVTLGGRLLRSYVNHLIDRLVSGVRHRSSSDRVRGDGLATVSGLTTSQPRIRRRLGITRSGIPSSPMVSLTYPSAITPHRFSHRRVSNPFRRVFCGVLGIGGRGFRGSRFRLGRVTSGLEVARGGGMVGR